MGTEWVVVVAARAAVVATVTMEAGQAELAALALAVAATGTAEGSVGLEEAPVP